MRLVIALLLATIASLAVPARAPPASDAVDVGVRLPRVRTIETSNSERAAIAIKELLGERVDLATLPPRTPVTLWRDETGAIVGFRVEVDGAPFTVLRAHVNDLGFCGSDEECVAFVDDDGVTLAGDTLASPVDAWMVSSKVGERIHPITHRKRFHAGTDYAAPVGTPVMSVKSGVVIRATRSWTAGRYVIVRHDDGSEAKYFHLDERLVVERQRVNKGDLVGVVGKTGRVTGAHLHFELRDRRGCPLDMTVERWPGRARIDEDEARSLALRLRLLATPPTTSWPATFELPLQTRRSAVDVGALAQTWLERARPHLRARRRDLRGRAATRDRR